jgi:DNA modification methylase
MKLENLRIADLTPDPKNARQHDDKNLKAIMGSLKEFGQRKPIVITEAGTIVAGNGTVEAAKRLGWSDIEVVRVPADWTDAQVKAFAIADNRTAELANWNQEVLTSQLLELEAEGWELSEFGFEPLEMPVNPGEVLEDEVPETAPTRVALGDIWQLGNHRLICGDSSDPEMVKALMGDKKAELVFTDPPYRMNLGDGSDQWVGKAAIKVGESIKDIIDFDPIPFLESLPSYFDKTMNSFIFCNKDLVPDYLNWALSKGYPFNILFWKKPNALPLGGQHRPDLEYIIFVRKSAIWNDALAGVSYSKCLEFSRENSTTHPTMKPVQLIVNQLLISSNKGGIVVDPFLGSGSTLVAAEQTGRLCYGFELEPKYCDIILTRWEKLTGQKAELLPAKAD